MQEWLNQQSEEFLISDKVKEELSAQIERIAGEVNSESLCFHENEDIIQAFLSVI